MSIAPTGFFNSLVFRLLLVAFLLVSRKLVDLFFFAKSVFYVASIDLIIYKL